MFRQSVISGVLILAVGCPVAVRADETGLRKELKQIAAVQMAAFKRKDVKAFMKYIAPNYSETMFDGKVLIRTRQELEDYFLSDMEETVSISFVTRDLKKFEVEANTFTVVVNQKSARVIRDGASRHKWEFNVVQRERWIKTDDGLKLSSLEGLEVVYMIKDGKLIEGSRGKKPKGRLPHGTILKSKDLVLVGTIMEINPRAGGVSRKNWAVVVRVERVVAGEFSGMTFTFAIHSPAMSGLRLGQAYTIKATWTPEGYVVGSTVEEARAPRMKKAGNH